MAEELAQARAPFVATVEGVSLVVRVGDVYRKTDPVVAASPTSFQDVEVLDSSAVNRPFVRRPGLRAPGEVETATAAPGERRTLTAPVVEAPAPPATGRKTPAKEKVSAAAAPTPSEV